MEVYALTSLGRNLVDCAVFKCSHLSHFGDSTQFVNIVEMRSLSVVEPDQMDGGSVGPTTGNRIHWSFLFRGVISFRLRRFRRNYVKVKVNCLRRVAVDMNIVSVRSQLFPHVPDRFARSPTDIGVAKTDFPRLTRRPRYSISRKCQLCHQKNNDQAFHRGSCLLNRPVSPSNRIERNSFGPESLCSKKKRTMSTAGR